MIPPGSATWSVPGKRAIQPVTAARLECPRIIAIRARARIDDRGVPHAAARVPGVGDARENLVKDAPAAGLAALPDPLQHRPAQPVSGQAQLLVPFPLLSGLPLPFLPGPSLPHPRRDRTGTALRPP